MNVATLQPKMTKWFLSLKKYDCGSSWRPAWPATDMLRQAHVNKPIFWRNDPPPGSAENEPHAVSALTFSNTPGCATAHVRFYIKNDDFPIKKDDFMLTKC